MPSCCVSLSATAAGRTVYHAQYDRQSVIKKMEIAYPSFEFCPCSR